MPIDETAERNQLCEEAWERWKDKEFRSVKEGFQLGFFVGRASGITKGMQKLVPSESEYLSPEEAAARL